MRPRDLPRRLAPLALGFCIDEVRNGFSLGEVEPAGVEGAAGEFTGLGDPTETGLSGFGQHRLDDRRPTVEMEFDDVLAGEGVRAGHPDNQRFIDNAAFGIAQDTHQRAPGRWSKVSGKVRQHPQRTRSGALPASGTHSTTES